jgi:hypothetical protein
MARQRFDSAPQFNVGDDGVVIQQESGSSAVPFQILNSGATPLFTVENSGQVTIPEISSVGRSFSN